MATIVPFVRKVADIRIENHGSIVLLRPITKTGQEWLTDNCTSDESQWFGRALACEPRFVAEVVRGAIDCGLTIQ